MSLQGQTPCPGSPAQVFGVLTIEKGVLESLTSKFYGTDWKILLGFFVAVLDLSVLTTTTQCAHANEGYVPEVKDGRIMNLTIHLYTLPIHTYNAVGHATCYGMDGPGIESRWRRCFPHSSRLVLGPTQSPVQWAPGLFRRYSGRGVVLTTNPHIVTRLKKE
jgi:hypothetical protein